MKRTCVVLYALLSIVACDNPAPPQAEARVLRPAVAPPTTTVTSGRTLALAAKDFNSAQVVALVESPDFCPKGVEVKTCLARLQGQINDSSSGINNVNIDGIDGDDQVDYIKVVEKPGSGGAEILFIAYPSKACAGGEDSPECKEAQLPIYSLNTTQATGGGPVTVVGTYPSYVSGYQDYYYSRVYHDHSLANALFLYALLRPHPLWVSPLYTPAFYRPYAVRTPIQVTSVRNTYVTKTKVAPVPVAARPASYVPPPSVAKYETKVASKYATPSAQGGSTQSSTLRGAAAGVSDFKVAPTGQSPSFKGFGAPSATAKTPAAPASAPAAQAAPAPAPKKSWWESKPAAPAAAAKPASTGNSWWNSKPSTPSGGSGGGGIFGSRSSSPTSSGTSRSSGGGLFGGSRPSSGGSVFGGSRPSGGGGGSRRR